MKDVPKAIEAVWKIESTRLIAAIARVTHDIGIAEELAQDALVTALELWPEEGIPENPGAWLMTAAKRRAIDSLRRGQMLLQKHEAIARELEWQQQQLAAALEHSLDQVIDDDILRLIFTACHPVLTLEARTALTLRLICGLTTAEIARAFLVRESSPRTCYRCSQSWSRSCRHNDLPLSLLFGLESRSGRRSAITSRCHSGTPIVARRVVIRSHSDAR
jgi:RNA polymerase sigma-70 factor (ECF subfamily)